MGYEPNSLWLMSYYSAIPVVYCDRQSASINVVDYVPLFCETRWLGMSGETEHVFAVLDIIHANCEPVSYPSWRNYLARFSLPEIHDSDAYLEFCIRKYSSVVAIAARTDGNIVCNQ